MLLAIAMIFSMLVATPVFAEENVAGDGNFSGGFGTEESPYLIANKKDLLALRDAADGQFTSDVYYLQTADIDMANTKTWSTGLFSGGQLENMNYNGGNHVIYNLNISRPVNGNNPYYGLFEQLGNGCVVRNLGMIGCTIEVSATASAGIVSYVGPLVGAILGGAKVYNCFTHGNNLRGLLFRVGGLIGYLNNNAVDTGYTAHVVNCYSTWNAFYDNWHTGTSYI
ncbi:MAG: hypothetical protein IIU74_07195, partial [Ruminiclostridium sp.]|nr:hypothetical protein [Ruminiclostridium sp.]